METEAGIDIRPAIKWTSGMLAVMAAMSVYAWFMLPADALIAVHWGIEGKPDGWAPKLMGLAAMPALELMLGVIWVLSLKLMPRRHNVARSARAITIIWVASMLFPLVAHASIVVNALGTEVDVPFLFQMLAGVAFIVLGNYMGKIRSNFFAGIRTPWTLSSELSWNKTHRLGGKLFVVAGALLIAGHFTCDLSLWVWLLLAQLITIALITFVYSYHVWKIDPYKHSEGSLEESTERRPAVRIANERMVTWVSVVLLLVVGLGFVFAGTTTSKPSKGLEVAARQLVKNLAAGNYKQAEARFDDTMRKALPPEKLKAAWESTIATNGKFVSQKGTRTSRLFPYTLIYVTCKFDKATQDIKVVFSPAGKVSGLWIVPTGAK